MSEQKIIKASDCKCCECGKQAEVFWPVIDPDIPSHPYCRKCVAKEQAKLMIELDKINKKYKRK
jgi:hypothetical protein